MKAIRSREDTDLIDVTDLTCIRNGTPIFDGVSFRLYQGVTYGVTGEGAGDLLAILAGCLGFSAGRVNLNGFDLQIEPVRAKRGGGYLPADPNFGESGTVFELLSEVAALRGMSERQGTRAVNAMLEAADLEGFGDHAIDRLTLPQKRRLWLAQAMIGETDRLFLVEPTLGLNDKEVAEILEMLDALRGERTVLIATADERVLGICRAMIRIENGKVTVSEVGTTEKTEISLIVRGERTAIFGALSRIPTIESCRPGIPNNEGDLPLTVIAHGTDPQSLTEQIRTELQRDGLPILAIGSDEEGDAP